MKKVFTCMVIGMMILIVESFADCACCGASTTTKGSYIKVTTCSAGCGTSCTKQHMCNTCGKCSVHCSCEKEDDSSSSSSSSHSCSFYTTCSEEHCKIKICDDCGRHKNDEECGGGCNKNGYCTHCSESYCTICDDHSCRHNRSGYCSKPHCTSNVYCTKCGHTCDGDHKYGSLVCDKAHCNDLVCTVSGCSQHKTGVCGGGHTEGAWKEEGNVHNQYCGMCTEIVASHGIYWLQADSNHMSICSQNCGLTYTHEAEWGEYFLSEGMHVRNCIVKVGESSCSATISHSPVWSEYVKADRGGEESGAEHLRYCTVEGCDVITDSHGWSDNIKWHPINDEKHRRTCTTCGLTQTLAHDFVNREAIVDDIENHNKVCVLCVDDGENNYKVLEKHIDEETDGRGDGFCDLCNKSLWRIDISNTEPTNEDITVKVEIFSDYEDKIEFPVKMVDEYGNELIKANGEYTISKNGQYIFKFESPDVDVIVNINNISKSIYGKVFITPDTATTDYVTLKLVTSTEGIDKTISLSLDNSVWQENVLEIERTVVNNGTYVFYAKDSLGNRETFAVNINNIVSGFGTVTTTYDAFINGYIFTDILVNINQAWAPSSSLINCLSSSVYKYKVDGDRIKIPVNVNKVMITDALGNIVTDRILNSGEYYLRVAIGGNNVFNEVGTYMVEIKNVSLENNGEESITLEGKNRIEVVVQSLNDLT